MEKIEKNVEKNLPYLHAIAFHLATELGRAQLGTFGFPKYSKETKAKLKEINEHATKALSDLYFLVNERGKKPRH